jgi:hypothetical protein
MHRVATEENGVEPSVSEEGPDEHVRTFAAQTPLQEATLQPADAFRVARSDARTFETFLCVAIVRLAAEAAAQLEREHLAA